MSNDLLLVRETEPGWYNLSVGEPFFLQQKSCFIAKPLISTASMEYPPLGGSHQLIDLIKRTNTLAREYVVITNGAKQALLAALYAYKVVYGKSKFQPLYRPYWLSYPTLLELSGYTEETNPRFMDEAIKIHTSPNNPDGEEFWDSCHIWDAAYYHKVYGATFAPHNWIISIWSMAKAYGISGARIGYATTSHLALARAMAEYVEKTTSGVSMDSQQRAIGVLDVMCANPCVDRFSDARTELLGNGAIFLQYLSKYIEKVRGLPYTGKGMFAWADMPSISNEILQKSNVRAIPGSACGIPGTWWRFSMGHSNDITEMACRSLQKELN